MNHGHESEERSPNYAPKNSEANVEKSGVYNQNIANKTVIHEGIENNTMKQKANPQILEVHKGSKNYADSNPNEKSLKIIKDNLNNPKRIVKKYGRFRQRIALWSHKNIIQGKIKKYSCSICDKIFSFDKILKNHIRIMHKKEKTEDDVYDQDHTTHKDHTSKKLCDPCGAIFKNLQHTIRKDEQKPFEIIEKNVDDNANPKAENAQVNKDYANVRTNKPPKSKPKNPEMFVENLSQKNEEITKSPLPIMKQKCKLILHDIKESRCGTQKCFRDQQMDAEEKRKIIDWNEISKKIDKTKTYDRKCVRKSKRNKEKRSSGFLPLPIKLKSQNPKAVIDVNTSEMNKASLNPSIRIEEVTTPISCHKCDLCFKMFSQKAGLKFHLMKVHKMGNLKIDLIRNENNDGTFSNNLVIGKHVCDICKDSFKSLIELNEHNEKKHEKSTEDDANSEETENTEEENQNEMQNLTEEELACKVEKIVMDDSIAIDFKPKLDLPNLVYLHAGVEKRLPLEKYHYEEFIEFLQDKLFELQSEEIEIDWYGYGLSRGIIGCQNVATAIFIKNAISNFAVGDQKFRGWLKNEYGGLSKKDIFTGYLDGKYWQGKDPKESMTLIFKMNKIKGKFNVILCRKTFKGVQVTFETSGDVTNAIKQKCNVLNAGLSKLKLICNE